MINTDIPISTHTQLQIQQKRQQFYIQIKQRSKQKIMNTIRCQYLKQERDQILSQLIQKTMQQINQSQLKTLIFFAEKKMNNAVIHIGNLFLEEVLDFRVFEINGIQWLRDLDADSGYYQWLLIILLNRRYVDTQFDIYLKMTKHITQSKPQDEFRVLNFLKCLIYLSKNYKSQFLNILILNKEFDSLSYILSNCTSKNKQISKQAWRVANNVFNQQNDQLSLKIICSYGVENFLLLVEKGLMSVYSYIRALACQILTNNISTLVHEINIGFIPVLELQNKIRDIIRICLNLSISETEKQSVKVQVSYMLVNYLQNCSFNDYSLWILSEGLAKVINQLKFKFKDGVNDDILKNCHKICSIMTNICYKKQVYSQNQQFLVDRIYIQLKTQDILVDNETEYSEYTH